MNKCRLCNARSELVLGHCNECRKKAIDVYAIVVHAYFGCDTGCCGHAVEVYDRTGENLERHFDFSHPLSTKDKRAFAQELVDEYTPYAPLDWEKCEIQDIMRCP
jgi:hypothetical protein